MHPPNGDRRRYGQVYILDASEAVEARSLEDPTLSQDVIQKITEVMDLENPYSREYKRMAEIENAETERASRLGITPSPVTMIFQQGPDQRRYNAPAVDEVAAVFVGKDGAPPGNHDIVIYPRDKPLQNISYLNNTVIP